MANARGQRGPTIGNEREKESGAACPSEPLRGRNQVINPEGITLEIDTGETIYLNIHQPRRQPKIGLARLR